MANEIRLKRRASSGATGAPTALKNAEPAFNEADKVLYYGFGDDGSGDSTSIISIGGEGAFLTLSTAQTVTGDKTFSGAVIAPTRSAGDSTTNVATTAFVDGEINALSQTISVAGDSGTGTVDLKTETLDIAGGTALTSSFDNASNTLEIGLDNTAVTAAAYGSASAVSTFTVDSQGRLTAAGVTSIDITHTQVNDFDTGVQANRLDQMAAPTAAVSMNSQELTNVADPTSSSSAANKGYVDSVAQGLEVKKSCRTASDANINISSAPAAIGGVTLSSGDRVLIKSQLTSSENGLYVFNGSSSALTRTDDANTTGELTGGSFVFVEEGNNADNGYVVVSDGSPVIGTDLIAFEQFSGAGQIDAGNGIEKSGNELSVDVKASGGLSFSSGKLRVNLDHTSILGTLAVGNGGSGATTLTGILKGNGTSAFTAAVDETDYLSPNAEIDGGSF